MPQLSARRSVSVPPSVAWEVITDHDVYADVAPNLVEIEVLEGEREGLRRWCLDTGGNDWTETVHHWDEGRSFGVTVDVANSAFHRPLFHRFEGHWGLTEEPSGVQLWTVFEYDTRWGPMGWLVSAYLKYRARGMLEHILDGWVAEMEARLEADGSTNPPQPVERRHLVSQ